MINISYFQLFYYLAIGAALLMISPLVAKLAVTIYRSISAHFIYKEKIKEVEKMKAGGDYHDWVSIAVSPTKQANVCKKTGYCPTLEGFIDLKSLELILKMREQEKEYQEYRKKRITDIGNEIGLGYEAMSEYADKIIGIKTQYTIEKLSQLQKELISKSAE